MFYCSSIIQFINYQLEEENVFRSLSKCKIECQYDYLNHNIKMAMMATEFVNWLYFEGHRPEVALLYAVEGWRANLKIN